jgi:LysR family hydrogen peroxide-inducible transcriptional activator
MPEIAATTEVRAAPGLQLQRFAPPEPYREIALIRRASTETALWFDELAELLTGVGTDLIATLPADADQKIIHDGATGHGGAAQDASSQ